MVCASQPLKIDELVRLVHPRDGHRKWFAMIEAYVDESGIHGAANVCVVAGYFGQRSQWKQLEKVWRRVLNRFDFPLKDFHAKDLLKTVRHRPMLLGLAKAISRVQVYPISMTVAVDDFHSFTHEQRRWLTGASFRRGKLVTSGAPSKPYFVPYLLLVRRVTDYAKPGSKAHFFCGLDRPFAEYARAYFAHIKTGPHNPASEWESKFRLGDIAFPMASETPQLQAADLLAHLTYLHMLERGTTLRNHSVKPSAMLALCLRNSRSQKDHALQDKACLVATFEKARQLQQQRLGSV